MHIFLFDIDGTLVDTGGAGRAALESALRSEFGVEQPARVALHGRTDRGIARDYFEHHAISHTPENWQKFRGGYLNWLHTHLQERKGRVLPGIHGLLAELAGLENVAVGLLTGNTEAGARVKLGHYELSHHFEFGGFGDTQVERNLVAEEALGVVRAKFNHHVAPERIYVIGDTEFDIRCAQWIGAKAVGVATGTVSRAELAEAKPDFLFDDLSQAGSLIELARL